MRKNKQISMGRPNASVKWAYLQYLFSSFWRRPVGYVIAIVYLIYLACILIIVPKAINNGPLSIWNLSTFNIPIFSLFFIGASCAALAVTVFRISQEDGTELSISAKPLTKGAMVGLKVFVYLSVMLVVTLLATIIAVLIKPIFGAYSSTNIHGITDQEYRGIILSTLIGNLVNILIFSGISILMSMVGGQVITMVTSIGIALVLVMLNFVYSKVVKTPSDIISDTYQTSIDSVHTYTRKQYDNREANPQPQNYAAIECYVNDEGEEYHHYDTYEYWLKAEKEAKTKATAYLDFGNQLSYLYKGFGLEGTSLSDVEKLPIGNDTSYKYEIDKDSKVTKQKNIDAGNVPISVFNWKESQGKYYPCVATLGPKLKGALSEWYLYSIAYNMDFDAVAKVSSYYSYYIYPGKSVAQSMDNTLALNMSDMYLSDEQMEEAKNIADDYWSSWSYSYDYFNKTLTTSPSGIWEGEYSSLTPVNKFKVNSKLVVYFMIYGQEEQDKILQTTTGHTFPYSTAEVVSAYISNNEFARMTYKTSCAVSYGFFIGTVNNTNLFSMLNACQLPYCETFNNMYAYKAESLYSIAGLSAIWGSISIALFAIAIVTYKMKDFK